MRRGDRLIELTRTEFTLLEMFLRRPRRVLERSFILEEVWGYDFPTTANSLEVYVGYLRRKTEAEGEPRLLHTVRGVGYVLKDSDDIADRARRRRRAPLALPPVAGQPGHPADHDRGRARGRVRRGRRLRHRARCSCSRRLDDVAARPGRAGRGLTRRCRAPDRLDVPPWLPRRRRRPDRLRHRRAASICTRDREAPTITLGRPELEVAAGDDAESIRTIPPTATRYRVVAVPTAATAQALVLAQSLESQEQRAATSSAW